MSNLQPMKPAASTLRWGGLAGIGGGVLFILVFILVGAVVGPDPVGPAGPIERFPDIRGLRTIENGLYLAVLVMWVPSYLVLYRAMGAMSPAAALFGSAIGIVGLGVMAAGALPHAATVPLSAAYHAADTTAAGREALVVAWQTTQGLFDALLITGLGIMPPSLILLGLAMLRTPAFGRALGLVTVSLGVAAAGSTVALLVDPESYAAVIGVFALIVFHIVAGARLYASARRVAIGEPAFTAAEMTA